MSNYNQVPEQQLGSSTVHGDGAVADALHNQPHVHQVASLVPDGHGGRATFPRRDALIRHIRSKNKEAIYRCLECNKPFARADKLKDHLRLSHGHGEDRVAGATPQVEGQEPAPMLVAAVAAEPQEHVPASTPQAPQFPGTLALPFSCMEPGCFRFGSAGFAHDDDLHLHTLGYHVPVQASVSHQPGPAYANAFGHENGYNQGQGVNNHPIEGLIPGDSYSMNATGEQTDEHWHFENYEPADGPFQHGSYMNGLDGQDGDQSHGQWV